jgi:hypothetical protein
MQAYQGYFENGRFITADTVKIPERRRIILTVLDEPVEDSIVIKQRKAIKRFINDVCACEEPLSPVFDEIVSQRADLSREVDL